MSYPQTEIQQEDRPERGRNGCTCTILFTLLLILVAAAYICLTSGVLPGVIGNGPVLNHANQGEQSEGETGAASAPTGAAEDTQPGNPEENTENPAFPDSESKSENNLTSSTGSGQTLNTNASDTFQAAQSCASDLGYPLEVNDHWDVWELVFYTIQYSEGTNNLPSTCLQFTQAYDQNGLGDFIRSIGGTWWDSVPTATTEGATCADLVSCAQSCAGALGLNPASYSDFELSAYLSKNYPDSNSRPADCAAFQNSLIQQEAQNTLAGQLETLTACNSDSVPSALCPQGRDLSVANSCAEKLDWKGDLLANDGMDEFANYVTDQFSLNFGDIPNECYQYVLAESLVKTARQNAMANINASATCLDNPAECRPLPAFGSISQSAVNCALDVGWNKSLETTTDLSEFFSYLIVTAPWLDSGELPASCLDFLNSTTPTALSNEYWQLLAASLSQNEALRP